METISITELVQTTSRVQFLESAIEAGCIESLLALGVVCDCAGLEHYSSENIAGKSAFWFDYSVTGNLTGHRTCSAAVLYLTGTTVVGCNQFEDTDGLVKRFHNNLRTGKF